MTSNVEVLLTHRVVKVNRAVKTAIKSLDRASASGGHAGWISEKYSTYRSELIELKRRIDTALESGDLQTIEAPDSQEVVARLSQLSKGVEKLIDRLPIC